jgi:iron complex transport system substrate-binding protein
MRNKIIFLVTIISFQIVTAFASQASMDTGSNVFTASSAQRIACLYAFSGHVVTMLDRGENIVAVVKGLKKDKLLRQIIPGIQDIPVVSSGGIIHIETLLNTQPDIVFLKPETAKIKEELKKLERFKLPYFVVGYNSMAQQMQTIEVIGKAIGSHSKSLDYNTYYKTMIDLVKSRTQQIPKEKRVRIYHSINEPYRTDAPGTLEADWTEACGVINVSVNATLSGHDNKKFASIEQILLWNPGVIIANEASVAQLILTDKKWVSLGAVQQKKVFTIPVGISRWGHPGGIETPLAMIWTAKKIYPDLFQDINIEKEVALFYKQFFNLNLSDKLVNKILSGKGMRLDK